MCHSRVVVVATSVSDPAAQGPKTSSHGAWRVSSGRHGLRGSPKQGLKSLGLHRQRVRKTTGMALAQKKYPGSCLSILPRLGRL